METVEMIKKTEQVQIVEITMKCPYEKCCLPKNNNKYWFQFVLLGLSVCGLLKKQSEFTFVALLLFTIPVIMDLVTTEVEGGIWKFIRIILIGLNVILVAVGSLGIIALLIDTGMEFCIPSDSMVLPGFKVAKTDFVFPLLLEVCVPLLFLFATPNQEKLELKRIAQAEKLKNDKEG